MKSFRRRWAALSLAAVLCGSGSDARAKEVEHEVEGGMLFGVGIPEMSPRPTLRGDVTIWWAPSATFHLGLETGVGLTVLPYGCSDAVPFIGERASSGCDGGLSENSTVLPRALLRARFILGSRAAVGAFAGATLIIASDVAGYALYPYPTIGVDVETKVGPADRFRLRTGLGYIDIAYRDSRGFLAPTLAFVW